MSNKLNQALESLINGDTEAAADLLSQHIIETAASINQQLIEAEEDIEDLDREVVIGDMGDNLADEIEADKNEIEAEEMFDEDVDLEDAVEDLEADLDAGDSEVMDIEDVVDHVEELEADIEEVEAEVEEISDTQDDFEDKFEKLSAEFEKLLHTEEEEHGEDFDNDGVIGDPEVEEVDVDGEEEVTVDADEEHIDESAELVAVKADVKDVTSKEKSPVAKQKDRLHLEGKPVKIIDKGHKGFDREDKKVGEVTKHTNTVKSAKDAIVKAAGVKTKDMAPGAGEAPAMPKNN